jgi:hypothetical protein
MVYGVSGMAAILKAVGELDARIENIECSILAVNGELAALHDKFRLRFTVEPWIGRPSSGSTGGGEGQPRGRMGT